MSQLPRHHLRRPRLTDALQQASVGVVTGGGGYGKSMLATELGDVLGVPTLTAVLDQSNVTADLLIVRLRSAAVRVGLSDVAAQMPQVERDDPAAPVESLLRALADQPTLIVVDEIQNAAPDAVDLLLALAARLTDSQRLLLLGRHAPSGLDQLPARARTVRLGTVDLALTDVELSELCTTGFGMTLTPRQLADLRATTDGWLAAVVLLAARSGTEHDLPTRSHEQTGQNVLESLVGNILSRLSRGEQAGLVQIAHLPLLDNDIVAVATGLEDLLVVARSAGLPLSDGPAPWSQLIGPVQDLLSAKAPAQAGMLLRCAGAYAARGEVALAANLLIINDQGDAAAELLSALTHQEAERIDLAEFASLVERLSESSVANHPRMLLHLARVAEPLAETRIRRTALERADRMLDPVRDAALSREIEAEVARDLVWNDQWDDAEALASRTLAATGAGEELTRARLLEVLGRAAAGQKDDVHLGYAEERLQLAARTYRAHEQWTWLAMLMMPLAMWVHNARGAFDEALSCFDEALALVPRQRGQRGSILTFRTEVLDTLGRYDEADDNMLEAQAIADVVHDDRLRAYIEWDRARRASQQGDVGVTVAALAAVEAAISDWFDTSGCLFLCDAANYLDRLGLTAKASDYLARAEVQPRRDEKALLRTEATLLARSGDPQLAERQLQAVIAAPWFEAGEGWYYTLLRAYAAARRGDTNAANLTAESFAQAAKLGYPQLPLIRERAIAEELLALAASSGRLTALDLDLGAFPVVVSMLGRFEVTQAGRTMEVPAGQGRQLLKVIASAGGKLLADQAIEQLWPEIDPDVGANRLRTVLNRLRESVGELVIRDERSLRLLPHVHTDARRFEEGARRAQALAAAHSPEAPSVARSALAIYRGDLLPDDAYEIWATMPRERLRRHALSLLDLCADAAAAVGDLDEAVRCLVRATDLAPHEEERYLAVARHLLTQGRRGAARSYVDRARSVLEELSLSPPAALVDLDRLVRRV